MLTVTNLIYRPTAAHEPFVFSKRELVVDFLLVLNELFSLGVTVEALRAIIGSKSAISLRRGPADPHFHAEGGAPNDHFSSEN